MYGYDSFLAAPIPGKTKCVLFWGAPSEWWSGERFIANVMNCRDEGATVVCVDPRPTQEASLCDLWLQVRPGTDAALAMAILNVIIEEKLYDEEFVRKYTLGFDKLAEAVREMPPERASKIIWIPKDKIIAAARIIGKNQPMYIETPVGKITQKAYLSSGMLRRVVAADTFWTLPEKGEESLFGVLEHNFNVLIPDGVEYTDGMFGVLPYRGLICKV